MKNNVLNRWQGEEWRKYLKQNEKLWNKRKMMYVIIKRRKIINTKGSSEQYVLKFVRANEAQKKTWFLISILICFASAINIANFSSLSCFYHKRDRALSFTCATHYRWPGFHSARLRCASGVLYSQIENARFACGCKLLQLIRNTHAHYDRLYPR